MSTRSEWVRDKKINVVLQFSDKKVPELQDVPLVTDLIKTDEQRQIINLILTSQQMARLVAAPPDLPPERVAALRKAFDDTMKGPEFLASAARLAMPIEPVSGVELQRIVGEMAQTPPNIISSTRSWAAISDGEEALETLMLETVQTVVDGSPMDMLVAIPANGGMRAGILLSHYQHGLGPFTRRNAEFLAGEGYVVVAPDHYHHTPGETDLKNRKQGLRDVRLIADMQAATAYLRAHPMVNPDATAILGHCMGGRQALLGAATVPGFRCAIDCYGGGVMRSLGEGPSVFERLSSIACPVGGSSGR